MFEFFTTVLAAIGFLGVSYALGYGIAKLLEHLQAEREHRRKHEQQVVTILTRIADHTDRTT